MTTKQVRPDCYEYVRSCYVVPAYVGVKVRLGGRSGVLVNERCAGQYVYVLWEGDERRMGPYHPTDGLEYLP